MTTETVATIPTLSPEEKAAEAKVAREVTLPEKVTGLTPGSPGHEKITWAIAYGSDRLVRSLAADYSSQLTYAEERRIRELPAAKWFSTKEAELCDRMAPTEAALDVAAAYSRAGFVAKVEWLQCDDKSLSREVVSIDVPWTLEWLYVEVPTAE